MGDLSREKENRTTSKQNKKTELPCDQASYFTSEHIPKDPQTLP